MRKTLMESLDCQLWVENNFVGKFLDPLEDWQKRFLHVANFYEKPILINACRGSGKTELAAIIATHHILFRSDQTVLLASPGFAQSKELYRRCRRLYNRYDAPKPPLIADTKSSMELSNGSRLIVISGGNEIAPRSYRSNLIIADEVAHCDRNMIESALIPSMSGVPNGRFIGISTPNGREGNIFYEYWESEPGSFEKLQVTADESKRITKRYLAQMRAVTRPEKFDQEWNCKFVAGGDSPYFVQEIVDRCFVEITGEMPCV
jgi:hypothetical protein